LVRNRGYAAADGDDRAIAVWRLPFQREEMSETPDAKLRDALRRLPDWVRKDLAANDAARRERAEDTLCAILLPLLENAPSTVPEPGGA
jgi:hypothetical protein